MGGPLYLLLYPYDFVYVPVCLVGQLSAERASHGARFQPTIHSKSTISHLDALPESRQDPKSPFDSDSTISDTTRILLFDR